MIDLSVAIITLNEQDNLTRCLASIPKGVDIVVVDSGSQDATVDIAKSFGAKVYDRAFDNFSNQKNFAIEKCKRKWILSIDADEKLDDRLQKYFTDQFEPQIGCCYKINRSLVFNHQLLRFGKTSDAPIRLFPNTARFKNAIHESIEVDTFNLAKLPGSLIHYSYKSHSDYFKRFNSYTSKIADNHFKNRKKAPTAFLHTFRPFFEFFSRFILRLGFLDGKNGFTYALYSSLYTYVKYEKLIEKYNYLSPSTRTEGPLND